MKKLFTLLWFLFPLLSFAQSPQPGVDSVTKLIVQCFNEENADKLYELTGKDFRKAISKEQFLSICQNNLFPLGKLNKTSFEKKNAGIHKYKAEFEAAALALYISLDEEDKLSTFLLKEYVDESAKKTGPVPTNNKKLTELDQSVDEAVQPFIQLASTAGLSIGILNKGHRIYYHYGETAKGSGKLPTEKSLYEIGSITKTFTCLLLAQAVEEKKLRLNDRVSQYIPVAVKALQKEKPVTLLTLANHTSGLPRMPGNIDLTDISNPYKDYHANNLLAYLETADLLTVPGTTYAYSNLGMAVLGYILEKVYARDFETLVKEKITRPLNMLQTMQQVSPDASMTQGHNESGEKTSNWDFKIFAAAGALRSSTEDMLKYAAAFLGKAPASIKKPLAATMKKTFENDDLALGLGWHYIKIDREEWLFHNGGTGGFRSFLAIHPKKQLSLVLLSNSATDPDWVARKIISWMQKN